MLLPIIYLLLEECLDNFFFLSEYMRTMQTQNIFLIYGATIMMIIENIMSYTILFKVTAFAIGKTKLKPII